jgi:Uma2 family endonuclease
MERARPRISPARARSANGKRRPARAAWPNGTQRLMLHNIDWPTYDTLLHVLDGRHLRITYDQGDLEIMPVSPEHDRGTHLLRRLIDVVGEEAAIAISGMRSTTLRRANVQRGLEPDEWYYIGKVPHVLGKRQWDLTREPPPDLAVEVEVTRSALDRMGIYAALRVAEVWRFNGKTLRVFRLQANGQYAERDRSEYFPWLPISELVRFVRKGARDGDLAMARAFRTWVRGRLETR